MKKIIAISIVAVLALGLVLTGCGAKKEADAAAKTIVVGASSTPHAEILSPQSHSWFATSTNQSRYTLAHRPGENKSSVVVGMLANKINTPRSHPYTASVGISELLL